MKEGGAEERQGEIYPLGGLGDNERPEVRPEKRQDRECTERTGRPAGRAAGMVRWRNPPESLRGQQGKGVGSGLTCGRTHSGEQGATGEQCKPPAGLQVQLCCAGKQVGRLKEEESEVRARRPEADTTGDKGGSGPPGRTVSADGREAS